MYCSVGKRIKGLLRYFLFWVWYGYYTLFLCIKTPRRRLSQEEETNSWKSQGFVHWTSMERIIKCDKVHGNNEDLCISFPSEFFALFFCWSHLWFRNILSSLILLQALVLSFLPKSPMHIDEWQKRNLLFQILPTNTAQLGLRGH